MILQTAWKSFANPRRGDIIIFDLVYFPVCWFGRDYKPDKLPRDSHRQQEGLDILSRLEVKVYTRHLVRLVLHDGGRAQCDDEGLHPVEEAAQEGAQADSLLQDQKLADCGDGEHHLVRTTFFCSQCSVREYTFIQLYSIYKMVKIIH